MTQVIPSTQQLTPPPKPSEPHAPLNSTLSRALPSVVLQPQLPADSHTSQPPHPPQPTRPPWYGLTRRQRRFAEEYALHTGCNGRQAALAAGYSATGRNADTQAAVLLTHQNVTSYIDHLRRERDRVGIADSAERQRLLTRVARREETEDVVLQKTGAVVRVRQGVREMVGAIDVLNKADGVYRLDVQGRVLHEAGPTLAALLEEIADQGGQRGPGGQMETGDVIEMQRVGGGIGGGVYKARPVALPAPAEVPASLLDSGDSVTPEGAQVAPGATIPVGADTDMVGGFEDARGAEARRDFARSGGIDAGRCATD